MPRSLKSTEDLRALFPDQNNHVWEVIKTLVTGGTDASRLLELYYWSQEPGVVELIRVYLEMPDRAQRALADYLLNARPQSINAAIDMSGRLVVSQSDTTPGDHLARRRSSG